MVTFFKTSENYLFAVKSVSTLDRAVIEKLTWLFSGAIAFDSPSPEGSYIGPRREMITPWSTNAVEITQNMGISGIERIEMFIPHDKVKGQFDPMLQAIYTHLDGTVFDINKPPEAIRFIEDVHAYNDSEGLALNDQEIKYLQDLSHKIGRRLTDSEIFGFSQVNSEHCRHKIFNGTFIIDGKTQESTLFQLIKLTTQKHANKVVSAYKDNCAFLSGPEVIFFAPLTNDKPDFFRLYPMKSVISLKAETHNFPTTVEPFNGAATGSGGEIRDRIAGGKGAFLLGGTAVYMTSYPRLAKDRKWEDGMKARNWLYQTPRQILIKASNGASDFGNKFGQPLICGSLLTFEHEENNRKWAYDKVIMLAGGIGYGIEKNSLKNSPAKDDKIVLLGGDNYRIGMGGGAVSSVATGEYDNTIELNAVQRSNPEMQKRVYNAIRALAESGDNPIISIHDHGAGGHLNCLSELVENSGGRIYLDKLPIGDPTLSDKEIIGNESQERMGLVINNEHVDLLRKIADRERSPMYVIGEVTGDNQFTFENKDGLRPIDLQLEDLFGNPPKTVMSDSPLNLKFVDPSYSEDQLEEYLRAILQLEAVACKDWLTNKVDRSVTGLVAKQQTCGPLQLPLNDVAVAALGYASSKGVATSIGHAPAAGLVNAACGSVLSIAEALTNIIWAPLEYGLEGISLSANWMWPCRNAGEDARLYTAVKAASDFALALGINIPTGKDSLSMTQKYKDGTEILAPGTVIISASAEVSDLHKIVEPVLQADPDTLIIYIDFSKDNYKAGGSSFYQSLNSLGSTAPTVTDPENFKIVFHAVQELIRGKEILAGHDISAGGMLVTLLEMCFARPMAGLKINLDSIAEEDLCKLLFSENPGVIIQVKRNSNAEDFLRKKHVHCHVIGSYSETGMLKIRKGSKSLTFDIAAMRDVWYQTSYLLDRDQSGEELAGKRFSNYKKQELQFRFKPEFTGKALQYDINLRRMEPNGIKAAIIREKGVNGDREMAYMLHLAGFDVKDVHMTDLVSGRENLDELNLIVFVGGFSNSDVLGSGKGWAGAFLYNDSARNALDRFYSRQDTLSLGVCNGCQVMMELGLVNPEHKEKPKLLHNASNKFESAFLSVDIPDNNSVMFGSLSGSRLGIWVAHGEGRFSFPYEEKKYHVALKYTHKEYPGNPNVSDYAVAGVCSENGRHLAIMPHLERAIFPWNWAYYPENRKTDEISPWIEAFVNAREWIRRVK